MSTTRINRLNSIKLTLQANYTKNYNLYFISEGNQERNLSTNEIRFIELLKSSFCTLYTTLQQNKDNVSYWKEFVGGAMGFAMFFCSKDSTFKTLGLSVGMASGALAVKKEHNHQQLLRASTAFLKIINTTEELNKWNDSVSYNLAYRFQYLINSIQNNESGLDKLANFFIAQAIRTILNNQSEFESSIQVIDYVLKNIVPKKNDTAYDSFLNTFKLDIFKIKLITKSNNELILQQAIINSSARTESGSIYIRDGVKNPFEYPLQQLISEEKAKELGFVCFINVPESWEFLLKKFNCENIRDFKKIQPNTLLYVPKLYFEIFTLWDLASVSYRKIDTSSNVTYDLLKQSLTNFKKYLEFLFRIKNNLVVEYQDANLKLINQTICTGSCEAIQIIFFMHQAVWLTKDFQKIYSSTQIFKKYSNKIHGSTMTLVSEILTIVQSFEESLQNFYCAHINYVSQQEDLEKLLNPAIKDVLIDIPNGESLKAREVTQIPPQFSNFILAALNPLNLNKNLDYYIEHIVSEKYKDLIKTGALLLTLCISTAGAYFFGIIGAAGSFVVPIAANFMSEFQKYNKKSIEYRSREENRRDEELVRNLRLISSVNVSNETLKDYSNSSVKKNQYTLDSNSSKSSLTFNQTSALEIARDNYAEGKLAFHRKDITTAVKFFQAARDNYKLIKQYGDTDSVRLAEKRLEKIKNPDGKYSTAKLAR